MPMMSAKCLNMLLSALVENLGPSMHRYVPPMWYLMPISFAAFSKIALRWGQKGLGMEMWTVLSMK